MIQSKNESGSVLLSVLFIVMLAVAVVGAAYVATSNQIVQTSRSADVDALQTTAEGVLEYAYGKWKVAMDDNGLMNATATNALVSGSNKPAVPARMTIESLTIDPVDANGVKVAEAAKTYDYKMSFVFTYVADVKLSLSGLGGKRTVSLRRNLIYTSVPPTRGMFFSEGDFELYKPAKMVIGGDVHTNSNAHVSTGSSSSNLLFLSNSRVTYVGSYDNGIPAGGANWSNSGSNYAPSFETSLASQVKKVPEISGIGLGTASEYNTTDDNPNNDGNRELIEPPVAGKPDPDSIAASRIYNNAGILVTVTGPVDPSVTLTANNGTFAGGNISIQAKNGTTLTAAQATTIRNAVTNRVVTQKQTWVESGYWNNATPKKWVDTSHYETTDVVTQKTIYDKREVQEVPITNLNVGAITPTLNAATGFNGILYIYDAGAGDKKAIRLTNGGVLPTDGLTVATQDGMYIQGDYNTGTTTNPNSVPANSSPAANASTTVSGYTTKSAAVVADAIMVLSNSWSDDNDSKAVGSRPASNTTLNTALIGGYIPSSNSGNNGRSGYSGGMNNFPRFLETWSGDSMTFSGAFVSLYKSKNFTGNWDTGDIYVPPTRYWYFDTLLLSRVLPGIPPNGGFIRGALTRM